MYSIEGLAFCISDKSSVSLFATIENLVIKDFVNPYSAKQKFQQTTLYFFYLYIYKKIRLDVQVNPLLGRGFTYNIKAYCL